MILLLIFLFFCKSEHFIPECLEEQCFFPFIYHDFSNPKHHRHRKEIATTENQQHNFEWFPNQGTWNCSKFKGFVPHEGPPPFVLWGEVFYNDATCCVVKNMYTFEMWITVKHDEPCHEVKRRDGKWINEQWEIELHNIQIKGENGNIFLNDKKGHWDKCEDCYAFSDCKKKELLYIAARLNYADTPETHHHSCRGGKSCQMIFELFINGTKVLETTKLVMDKKFGVQIHQLEIAWIREMIEVEPEHPFEKVFLTTAWDHFLRDEDIFRFFQMGLNRSPDDGVCVGELCRLPGVLDVIPEGVDTTTLWVICIVVALLLLICCCCCCWALVLRRRRTTEEKKGFEKVPGEENITTSGGGGEKGSYWGIGTIIGVIFCIIFWIACVIVFAVLLGWAFRKDKI